MTMAPAADRECREPAGSIPPRMHGLAECTALFRPTLHRAPCVRLWPSGCAAVIYAPNLTAQRMKPSSSSFAQAITCGIVCPLCSLASMVG